MASSTEKHFDEIASDYDDYKNRSKYYYDSLKELLAQLIPKDKIVLEIGCGTGDLLNHLKPKKGFATDTSGKMVRIAKKKHKNSKNLYFDKKPISDYGGTEFDYIFMSDVVEHLEHPRKMFKEISKLMSENSVFVNTMANPLWEPVLIVAEKLGLKMPEGRHFRYSFEKIAKMLEGSELKVVKHDRTLLLPIKLPFSDTINQSDKLNNILNKYAFIEYFTAKKSNNN
jgi:2-polyprenyl-3-methyl-5-hydroxy-6-metoxy-1,4-benzoquinol methylase